MTSNAGSDIIQENLSRLNDSNREELLEKTRIEVIEVLKKGLRPEFLNRIDDIIMFHPLTMENLKDILMLQIDGVKEKLEEMGVKLEFTQLCS